MLEITDLFFLHWSQRLSEFSQLKEQETAKFFLGNKPARDLIIVDFPVPRSPKTRTPPIDGSIAVKIRASFICSCPTIAENGKYLFTCFLL